MLWVVITLSRILWVPRDKAKIVTISVFFSNECHKLLDIIPDCYCITQQLVYAYFFTQIRSFINRTVKSCYGSSFMSLSEHFAMSRLRDIKKNNACKLTEPVDGPAFWVGPEPRLNSRVELLGMALLIFGMPVCAVPALGSLTCPRVWGYLSR